MMILVVLLKRFKINIWRFANFTKAFRQKFKFVFVQVLMAHMGYYVDLTVKTEFASGFLPSGLGI